MQPRIALVHPYWDFWASSVSHDLRADREELLDAASSFLSKEGVLTASHVVSNTAEAVQVVRDLPLIDAVVVVATMAAPSAITMQVLDLLPRVPVVVWSLTRTRSLREDFSHSDITAAGATVGASMAGSALARAGRTFDVVASTLEEPAPIAEAVRRAAAAGRLSRARLLRIGAPIPGYTSVMPPEGGLDQLGPQTVEVSADTFVARVRQASTAAAERRIAEIHAEFDEPVPVDALGLTRAAAAEVALRALVDAEQASAGAMNCHAPGLRPEPGFGIAPCLALGRLTSEGVPFTCTGDVLTAVAMLAVQNLGYPTLYHEVEAIDHLRDEAILANTGEHDLRLCGDARPKLVANVWYRDDHLTAPCAQFSIPPGPATLVGFVYAPGPRFVVAEGWFTERSWPDTGTPHAGFRFAAGGIAVAWAKWTRAGVLHHSAATNAHIADDIEAIANHLRTEFVRV
jgi:L-fucose isomerase-like protein